MRDAIGFIGVGSIAAAVVEGLVTAPGQAPKVLLSPRNKTKSAALAERFPTVTVAESNQTVLDGSGTVFLALRPQAVTEALRPLRFDPRHTIVSLIPLPLSALAPLVRPARGVLRALLLPTCTQRQQAVPHWPETPEVRDLLERLGAPLPLREEGELNVLWASTAIIAAFYTLLETVSEWSASHGVVPGTAADYTASMAHALARVALSGETDRFSRLATEAATPGGLNEQVVGVLRAHGTYVHVREAFDAVLARISPPPPIS
jgi:pyrroline-5-carboxylate reductase